MGFGSGGRKVEILAGSRGSEERENFVEPADQPVVGPLGYFGPNLLLAVPELSGGAAGLPLAFVALGLLALTSGRRRSQRL